MLISRWAARMAVAAAVAVMGLVGLMVPAASAQARHATRSGAPVILIGGGWVHNPTATRESPSQALQDSLNATDGGVALGALAQEAIASMVGVAYPGLPVYTSAGLVFEVANPDGTVTATSPPITRFGP